MNGRIRLAMGLAPLVAATVIFAAQQPAGRRAAALDEAQVRAMVKRAIAMQHRTEEALEWYDRTERIVERDDDETTETTSRLVPVGASEVRVDLQRDGKAVPREEIAQKWAYVVNVIEQRTHRDDPDVKKEYEKSAKRKRDAARMIDAIEEAFVFHWAGRAMLGGRPVIELDYQPNPAFKPKLRFAGLYRQIWGKVWVDEASGCVVRLEAELRRDIPIGGGILGKVYKGSRVELEQAEAAPGAGVWLPTFASYDVEYRKFVFPGGYHRKMYAGDYRRIGPPGEALALLSDEHMRIFTPRN